MLKRGTAIAAVCVAAFAAAPMAAHAQSAVASDVKPGDWAYDAVQDLASKGLILGYPPSGDFLGGRTVTRFEMATLVDRVLAKLNTLAATTSAPVGPDLQPQIAETKQLVDQYHVELLVIGTNVTQAQADIATLQGNVATLQGNVATLQQGLSSTIDSLSDQSKQIAKTNAALKTKVDSGVASVKFSGLFQEWYLVGDKDVTNFGGGPGSGLGVTNTSGVSATDATIANTFRIRRAEMRFTGNINPQAYFNIMFDPSKNQNISFKSSATTATEVASTASTSPLQDFVVGYHVTPKLDLEAGQQKVPLSIEGYRSSGNLLTIERSLMNEVAYGAGRVGDIRDLGAYARYTEPSKFSGVLAFLDDSGNRQNLVDDNNDKELELNGQVYPTRGLQVGGYGEVSGGVNVNNAQRRRAGADFDYVNSRNELTGEFERGQDNGNDVDPSVAAAAVYPFRLKTEGAYLTEAYRLNAKWQAVTRYDYFNPDQDLSNNEKDLTLGLNYNIQGNNAKIQLNYIKRDISGPLNATGDPIANTSLGAGRYLYFTNFQESF